MESRMYARPQAVEEYLRSNPEKPFVSCEYMHAMGNSLGGMHFYTDLTYRYEQCQGGFIWEYIEQALYGTQLTVPSNCCSVANSEIVRPTTISAPTAL